MKQLAKTAGFALILFFGVGLGTVFAIFPERLRRSLRVQLLHRLAPGLLRCLGMKVTHQGSLQKKSSRGRLLVANHLSYVDVLLISSRFPAAFVTSKETEASWEGRIASSGGSLFVERRHRQSIANDLRAIQECLARGLDVVLFPEGTSTTGETLLPFRQTLIQAAVDAEAEVVSLFVQYPPSVREKVAFVGEAVFAEHLWNLMAVEGLAGSVGVLGVHGPTQNRKTFATWSYRKINQALARTKGSESGPGTDCAL